MTSPRSSLEHLGQGPVTYPLTRNTRMTTSAMDVIPRVSFVDRFVLSRRRDVPVRNALVPAEVTLRADVVEDRIHSAGVVDEEKLLGTAFLALLSVPPRCVPAHHRSPAVPRPACTSPVT